jgi:predicted tellurium resistance membrane protein TerC
LEGDAVNWIFLADAAATQAAQDIAPLLSGESLISLLTLTALEIVLGIDNIVFIAILVGKLPEHQRAKARRLGLGLAMGMRILLLLAIGWVMRLTAPLFSLPFISGEASQVSGKDLILLIGGLFLIGKATYEIHDKLEGNEEHHAPGAIAKTGAAFGVIITQILMLDIVFSLDSVITAVGMARRIPIMILAVVLAVGVMLVFAGKISDFVGRHPTMKILALSFLLLIGVMLVADAFDKHIPKGYIYFSMAFALAVEMLNMQLRKKIEPVTLRQSYVKTDAPAQA